MEWKQYGNYYILRIDKGEEVVATLRNFCKKQDIKLGKVSGIGAISQVNVGLFDTENNKFLSKELKGTFEITSLIGTISTMDGNPYLHLHITIADKEFNVRGGHLNTAIISATGEIVVEKISGEADRKFSEEIGLNLFSF